MTSFCPCGEVKVCKQKRLWVSICLFIPFRYLSSELDLVPAFACFFVCLFYSVEVGIGVGVGLQILFILYHAARPAVNTQLIKVMSTADS
jgi:MFS superfamily sulfate permease-like transporter